jgi:hypothetical protein
VSVLARIPFPIGDAGRRAVIALYLTPESADDLADILHSSDIGGRELRDAAREARAWLGEAAEGEPQP